MLVRKLRGRRGTGECIQSREDAISKCYVSRARETTYEWIQCNISPGEKSLEGNSNNQCNPKAGLLPDSNNHPFHSPLSSLRPWRSRSPCRILLRSKVPCSGPACSGWLAGASRSGWRRVVCGVWCGLLGRNWWRGVVLADDACDDPEENNPDRPDHKENDVECQERLQPERYHRGFEYWIAYISRSIRKRTRDGTYSQSIRRHVPFQAWRFVPEVQRPRLSQLRSWPTDSALRPL